MLDKTDSPKFSSAAWWAYVSTTFVSWSVRVCMLMFEVRKLREKTIL